MKRVLILAITSLVFLSSCGKTVSRFAFYPYPENVDAASNDWDVLAKVSISRRVSFFGAALETQDVEILVKDRDGKVLGKERRRYSSKNDINAVGNWSNDMELIFTLGIYLGSSGVPDEVLVFLD